MPRGIIKDNGYYCSICKSILRMDNEIGLCRKHKRSLPIGKEREKRYYLKNYEKNLKRAREYVKNHRKERTQYAIKYIKNRMAIDPLFKLKKRLQEYTSKTLRKTGGRGYMRTIEILGADMLVVREHLEKKFTKGMSWENYGQWHIDHIIPLSSANNNEEALVLCKYTNLQPLWSSDNRKKSDKIM